MKKEQNGRESLRRIKPTVGCNASKRRKINHGNRRVYIYIYIYPSITMTGHHALWL